MNFFKETFKNQIKSIENKSKNTSSTKKNNSGKKSQSKKSSSKNSGKPYVTGTQLYKKGSKTKPKKQSSNKGKPYIATTKLYKKGSKTSSKNKKKKQNNTGGYYTRKSNKSATSKNKTNKNKTNAGIVPIITTTKIYKRGQNLSSKNKRNNTQDINLKKAFNQTVAGGFKTSKKNSGANPVIDPKSALRDMMERGFKTSDKGKEASRNSNSSTSKQGIPFFSGLKRKTMDNDNSQTNVSYTLKTGNNVKLGDINSVLHLKRIEPMTKEQNLQAVESFRNYIASLNNYYEDVADIALLQRKYDKAVKKGDERGANFYKRYIAYRKKLLNINTDILDGIKSNTNSETEARNARKLRHAKDYVALYEQKVLEGKNVTDEEIKAYEDAAKLIKTNEIEKEAKKSYSNVSNYFDYLALNVGNNKFNRNDLKNIPKNTSYEYNKGLLNFTSIYANGNYEYGGDQSSFTLNKDALMKDKNIDKIVAKYYPDKKLTNKAKKRLLTWMETQGCGYIALSNTIYNDLESRNVDYKNYFEKNFGFSPYEVAGTGNQRYKVLNYDYLALDFYLYKTSKANESFDYAVPKTMKSITDYRNATTENEMAESRKALGDVNLGSSLSDDDKVYRNYLRDRGFENANVSFGYRDGDKNYRILSESGERNLVKNYASDHQVDKAEIKRLLDNGKQITLAIGPIRTLGTQNRIPLILNNSSGQQYELDGNHQVTLTDIDADGNYVISSWGEKYTFDNNSGIIGIRVTSLS